jgi:1,4-alpha-glucan branching enzyme
MRSFYVLLLLIGTLSNPLSAQQVWVEPFFPTINDEVTIFFDATKGNKGLENCSCDVYIHTGVLTTESANPTDWKNVPTPWGTADPDWQLDPVPGQDQLFQYEMGTPISDFYNLQATDTVSNMAFVFRNGDGSQEAKSATGSDIYYPIYPADLPFSIKFLDPIPVDFVTQQGTEIPIRGVASENADLSIWIDGVQVTTTTGDEINHTEIAQGPGQHAIEFRADNGLETISTSFQYVVVPPITAADPPAGTEWGMTFVNDSTLRLALHAPGKNHVFAVGNFSNWGIDTAFQLRPSLDGQTWWRDIPVAADEDVLFQYLVDGTIRIADPYSTLVLDPWNDPFIEETTNPSIPDYPAAASGIVAWIDRDGFEYDWQTNDFVPPPKEELVVYELLIRDWVEAHDYQTLIDSLDYFTNLGINAIELMPVCEFEGNISWGYNPSHHMALDKYYGTPKDFKSFIDSCHARGIAVIVDIVYNHAFSQSPLVQLYWTGSQPSPESPWFNEIPTHPFNVGFDFNHESPDTKFFVDKNLRYWLEEFRIDGFRFDLSKGFTQVDNLNDVGAWGQYDASRIAILKEYADTVWAANPDAYVIMEHFAQYNEEKELSDYGMMCWSNLHGAYTQAGKGFPSSLNDVSYFNQDYDEPVRLTYMESHDEERIMYTNLEEGNTSNQFHNIRDLEVALRRIELNSAFFYPVPGPKMLWQFGEYGYDYNIDFNGRTGPKPIRWDYLDEPDRKRLLDVTSALINLRNNHRIFHTDDFDVRVSNGGNLAKGKSIQLYGADTSVVIIGNFDVYEFAATPYFPFEGTWYEYFSGDSLEVTNVIDPILLTPSEYRLYTNVPLEAPPGGYIETTGVDPIEPDALQLKAFPNPTSGPIQVAFTLQQSSQVDIRLFGQDGSMVSPLQTASFMAGTHRLDFDLHVPGGLYWLLIQAEGKAQTVPIVVR